MPSAATQRELERLARRSSAVAAGLVGGEHRRRPAPRRSPTHCSAPGRSPSSDAREHRDDRAGGDDRRDDAHRPERERAVEGRAPRPTPSRPVSDAGHDRAARRRRGRAGSARARPGRRPGRRARPSPPGACGSPGRARKSAVPQSSDASSAGAPITCSRPPRRPCTASSSRRIRSGLVPAASTSSSVSSCSAIAPASSGWPCGQVVDRDRRHVELGDRGEHVARRACRAASARARVDPDDDDPGARVGGGQVAVQDLLDARAA